MLSVCVELVQLSSFDAHACMKVLHGSLHGGDGSAMDLIQPVVSESVLFDSMISNILFQSP